MNTEDEERVNKFVSDLGEYFECVQVFVCNHNDDGDSTTDYICKGSGNILARVQLARGWVIEHDEWSKMKSRKRFEREENNE